MISLFDLRSNSEDKIADDLRALFDEPVNVVQFADQPIASCIGCWSCWLKTPGLCVIKDSMSEHYSDYVKSSKVILLFGTAQGFIDHKAKAFLDRLIPHYHPYIEIINQECHHVARYDRYPDMYFYIESAGLTVSEIQVIEAYLARTAFHFRSDAFLITKEDSIRIEPLDDHEANRHQIPISCVKPMHRLIIYNGSPRQTGSNSTLILDHVKQEMGDKVEVRDLKQRDKWKIWAESFPTEDHILFFMPLYVHAMPSHVMAFLEKLHPSAGSISFFVQSGFPESSQSHFLEAYFEQLSVRLSRQYLGTAIKGGVEGMQTRPYKTQRAIMHVILQTISHLVNEGHFDQVSIEKLAIPVTFGCVISKIIHLFGEKSINTYWDRMLIANGAYEKRFDRPYMT